MVWWDSLLSPDGAAKLFNLIVDPQHRGTVIKQTEAAIVNDRRRLLRLPRDHWANQTGKVLEAIVRFGTTLYRRLNLPGFSQTLVSAYSSGGSGARRLLPATWEAWAPFWFYLAAVAEHAGMSEVAAEFSGIAVAKNPTHLLSHLAHVERLAAVERYGAARTAFDGSYARFGALPMLLPSERFGLEGVVVRIPGLANLDEALLRLEVLLRPQSVPDLLRDAALDAARLHVNLRRPGDALDPVCERIVSIASARLRKEPAWVPRVGTTVALLLARPDSNEIGEVLERHSMSEMADFAEEAAEVIAIARGTSVGRPRSGRRARADGLDPFGLGLWIDMTMPDTRYLEILGAIVHGPVARLARPERFLRLMEYGHLLRLLQHPLTEAHGQSVFREAESLIRDAARAAVEPIVTEARGRLTPSLHRYLEFDPPGWAT